MTLPVGQLAKGKIEINGEVVEIRSLSRREAVKIATDYSDDADGGEVFILMCGTGCTEDEAVAFRDNTDPMVAAKLIEGIARLSGIPIPENGKGPKG